MNIQSLVGSLRRKAFTGPSTRVRARKHISRLRIEELERREVPAVLPTPVLDPNQLNTIDRGAAPFTAVDPIDANRIVMVYTQRVDHGNLGIWTQINIKFSLDGGVTWGTTFTGGYLRNPKLPGNANPNTFTDVNDATVAFDRFHHFYVAYSQRSASSDAGVVLLEKYRFDVQTPLFIRQTRLRQWVDVDAAYSPFVAIDTKPATFTDPDTGLVETNPHTAGQTSTNSTAVYVTYVTENAAPPGAGAGFNPNTVLLAVSTDGGASFSTAKTVNDTGNFGSIRYSFPKITFAHSDNNQPGATRLVVAFEQRSVDGSGNTRNTGHVVQVDTSPVSSVVNIVRQGNNGQDPQGQPIIIQDALNTTPNNTPQNTDIPIQVNATGTPGFTAISDVGVRLATRNWDLATLQANLIAPDGVTIANLFLNRTDAGGNVNNNIGISGTNLGVQNGVVGGTTFDDGAPRSIHDGADPYIAVFHPEAGLLSVFNKLTPAQATGTWTLRITDFRNGGNGDANNPAQVALVQLTLTSGISTLGFGADRTPISAIVQPIPADGANPMVPINNPAVAPFGIMSNIALAADTTLGSFSQFQNRLYMAFTGQTNNAVVSDRTNIYLAVSDNGGLSWLNPENNQQISIINPPKQVNDDNLNDGFSTGTRAQWLPTLTVDQKTGTLVVSYYDARFDANRTRVVTTLMTSIDGGKTFSSPTFLNHMERALDQVRTKLVDVEPVPSNFDPALAGPRGAGTSMALFANAGHVTAVYAGNMNLPLPNGTLPQPELRQANVDIGAGPRVVRADMGPMTDVGTGISGLPGGGTLTWNNTFDPTDGRRLLTGFTVEFDRFIDPGTFSASDVSVNFLAPDATVSTPVQVLSVTPLRDPTTFNAFGAKRFLIRVAAQRENGTYSYEIQPTISDRIRTIQTVITPSGTTLSFPSADVPKAIPDFPAPGATSNLAVGSFPANAVVGDINVRVNITHGFDGDLTLVLQAPTGQQFTLSARHGGNGDNYTNTVFDDQAPTPIGAGTAPFNGSFRPDQSLASLRGSSPNGVWRLIVTDGAAGDAGTLNSWSLDIQSATVTTVTDRGNDVDQDADSITGEIGTPNADPQDLFEAPASAGAGSFTNDTLPVVLPGLHVVQTLVRNHTTAQVVKDLDVSAVDVVFDRTVLANTFTKDDVVGIVGPLGSVADPKSSTVSVTPLKLVNGVWVTDSTLQQATRFRITFPAQNLPGNYRIQLGSDIHDLDGNGLDTNLNAGVANLKSDAGPGPFSTSTLVPSSPYNSTTGAIVAGKESVFQIQVPDANVIKKATINVSLTHPNVNELEARLVSPPDQNGKRTVVVLFTKIAQSGPTADLSNTLFDDDANTSITVGNAPFSSPNGFLPQLPLGQLVNKGSKGTWELRILNKGTTDGQLTGAFLKIFRAPIGTGLGEEIADRASIPFRIFVSDPTSPLFKNNWTPVGPSGIGGGTATESGGRVGAIAVDPSDPSMNTVYAGGVSGGVWRTTNFLTRDAAGPTWVPLTDFGPATAINISSIAVFNDSSDPNSSIIIAGTGENSANVRNPASHPMFTNNGVGFLISRDGGRSWTLLDSSTNSVGGTALPINDPGRDHVFVGSVVNKVVVDPTRYSVTGQPVFFAAVAQGAQSANTAAAGVWRSDDGGATWTKRKAGQATDFLLVPSSADAGTKELQKMYAAFEGDGVYKSVNRGNEFTLMAGGDGKPLLRDDEFFPEQPVAVDPAHLNDNPNGARGRIVLAAPPLANTRLENINYEEWLYAAVMTPAGDLDGLYMTKDAGRNWTRLTMKSVAPTPGTATLPVFPTNDETGSLPDVNVNGDDLRIGRSSIQLAVDPTNPNIVFLGNDTLLRIDATNVDDPHNLRMYSYSNADGGLLRQASIGATEIRFREGANRYRDPGLFGFDALGNLEVDVNGNLRTTPANNAFEANLQASSDPNFAPRWNYVNLIRDPDNPFVSGTAIHTTNLFQMENSGGDVRVQFTPLTPMLESDYQEPMSINRLLTIIDPLTGRGRLLVGSDKGLSTLALDGLNNLDAGIEGTGPGIGVGELTGSRNGNIQLARYYDGAVQPSTLAAQIAGALFYGDSKLNSDVASSAQNVMTSGDLGWLQQHPLYPFGGFYAPGIHTEVDATGSGTLYMLRQPEQPYAFSPGDFFQVFPGGTPPGGSQGGRTNGLLQAGDNPATGVGQWNSSVRTFAVNPITGRNDITQGADTAIVISSSVGRIFRTVNEGNIWDAIGEPGELDGAYAGALAFGAPEPGAGSPKSDFIYAGTDAGHVFVTFDGGSWQNISAGLDGSRVMKIVASPGAGRRSAYAVTERGVYFMDDARAPGATWQNVTGNLFQLTHTVLGNTMPILSLPGGQQTDLASLAVDWRPEFRGVPGLAILYVGGEGGVFKSIDRGANWARYPDTATGGTMPVANVVDLDLSLGNVNPDTGVPVNLGSLNLLVATTLGRGTFAINVGREDDGPAAISARKTNQSGTDPDTNATDDPAVNERFSQFDITFSGVVDPSTFTPDDIVVIGPDGKVIDNTSINLQVVNVIDPPSSGNDQWRVTFDANSPLANDGFYKFVIGPNLSDTAGNLMNQDGVPPNGQSTDKFTVTFLVGMNDLADFVKDTYAKLLTPAGGPVRVPTVAEFMGTTVTNMTTARFAGLGVVIKELLSTFNASEARQRLVERLFNNGGAPGEIGNLLPSYNPVTGGDVTFYVNALKNGTRSPELIMGDIIATTDTSKGFYQLYFNAAGGNTNDGFLNKLYQDLFSNTIQFSWLPAATQATQRNQVATTTGRLTLTRSLIAGTTVKYFPAGNTAAPLSSTDFRKHMIELTYQRYLNRLPNSVDITAGKSLMARPLAANSLNGSEWLYWKVLSSKEYFTLIPPQSENQPPLYSDDGLHTDRAWVDAVLNARMYRPSTFDERGQYSQKVLDRFKTQRAAFVAALVNGTAYRDLQITSYFQFVHGRNPTDTERANAQTALKNGSTYQSLISARFATAEFYSTNAPTIANAAKSNKTWARAVYIKLFNENRLESDPKIVALASQGGSFATRQPAVLALLNGQQYRDILITNRFNLLLGRVPTGPELTAYENFLTTHRWEGLIVDILANGAASPVITGGLPREFWEIRN